MPEISGRRDYDPKLVIRPMVLIKWITALGVIVGAVSGTVNWLGTQFVRPAAVAGLRVTHDQIITNTDFLKHQVDSIIKRQERFEEAIIEMQESFEIMALDVCLRRASEPFARARLNCERRLR